MNKTEAIEKIKKILALANDRAATPEEKDTALKMANKLADKYGLRIETKQVPKYSAPQPKANFYSFNPKRAYSELIMAFAFNLSKSGFHCCCVKDGKKVVGIRYQATRDLTAELEKFYKMTIKSCERFKAGIFPENMSGRDKTTCWKLAFTGAPIAHGVRHDNANAEGNSLRDQLKKLKEELG